MRFCAIAGREAKLKDGTLSITQGANERSTLSGVIMPDSDQTISLGDRIGVFLDDVEPGARVFNGTSSVLYRAFSSGTVDNFTAGAWVYLANDAANDVPFFVGRQNNGYGVLYSQANNAWQLFFSGVATPAGAAATPEEWTFLVIKRSGGTARLYVNGVGVGSTTASAPNAPNGYLSVGAYRNSDDTGWLNNFAGRVSHFFLAHSAVSDADILAMYQAGPGGIGLAPDRYLTGTYWYYPIRGAASPEPASSGSASATGLTVTNANATDDGPMVMSANGSAVFAGEIDQAPRSGLGGQVVEDIEVRIGASDYQGLFSR